MALIETAKFPAVVATEADMLNWKNVIPSATVPSLSGSLTNVATSTTLATGTGTQFPLDNFHISIDDEVIFVGARSTDSLSGMVRGVDGTTAVSHSAAAPVNQRVTAKSHNQIVSEVAAIEASLGTNLVNIKQDPQWLYVKDDFISGNLGAGSGIGLLSWNVSPFNSFVNGGTYAFPHVGFVVGSTTSTLNNQVGMDLSGGNNYYWGDFGAHTDTKWSMRFVFKLVQTTLVGMYIGPNNGGNWFVGFGLRYDTSLGDTDFMAVQYVSGSPTAVSLGIAADTNWHTLEIYSDGITAAKVYMSLDGGTPKTICSGGDINAAPTTSTVMAPGFTLITRTTAIKSMYVDFFEASWRLSTTSGVRI